MARLYWLIIVVATHFILLITAEDAQDIRVVSYDDLLPNIERFSEIDVVSFSQIEFDVSHSQILVGARDNLFRLSYLGLHKLEVAHWPALESTKTLCLQKGQSDQDCRNYIRVLLVQNNRILACGTNAFSPKCSLREIDNINTVIEESNGIGRCPYSPHHNVTALLTSEGDYYVGGTVDFSARDPAIYKFVGKSPGLRTAQYNHKWLSEPNFIASYEIGNFTYFIFRETAVEYINCGKNIYSRIARVCKNDKGGQYILKDNWTTFLKARLNCSLPGEYPFYYNEIQSIYFLKEQRILYATFTTPLNSILGSAVCAFNLSAIERAFNGPFKYQSSPSAAWERNSGMESARQHFQCETPNDMNSLESEKYQLMDDAIQPSTSMPFITAQLEKFSHIAVDVVATKHHEAIHILFVATANGIIKKFMILPRTQQTCLLEILHLFPKNHSQAIKVLKALKETQSLYVGTETSVMKIPFQRCNRFKTKLACINSMDPYCGWNSLNHICETAPQKNPLSTFWQQSYPSCPVLNDPLDGGWSAWGEWHKCSYMGELKTETSLETECFCRSRHCTNPSPQNGGRQCDGPSQQVSNCTRDGHWTEWSAWSGCSESCGLARKTRRRFCGNPEPAYGGKSCTGNDIDVIFCTHNPPCPALVRPSVDGHWSDWNNWNDCSAPCGGGYQMRRRRCDSPSPQNGGRDCTGTSYDYRSCNNNACPEHRKSSTWTHWLRGNTTRDGYYEIRYRFSCKANVPDPRFIKAIHTRKEERFCLEDGRNCIPSEFINSDGDWSEWSSWTQCSAQCGGGTQYRERSCDSPRPSGSGSECVGEKRMDRSCNIHPCNKLDGWDEWSEWSLCDTDYLQHRKRLCLNSEPGSELCQGSDRQSRMCVDSEESNDIPAMSVREDLDAGIAVGHLVAGCIVAFLCGAVITGIVVFLLMRKRYTRNFMKGNKHFINRPSSPNVYVPPKDCLPKNNYSSGTLTKNKGIPYTKEATIKRNGHKAHPSSDMLYE